MNDSIKMFNVHMDVGTIRRGHIHEAKRHINSDNLGWFSEGLYNTHSINFYDANKYSIEEILEIYKPYYMMDESEETEWVQDYQAEHGWGDHMIFDLDNPTATGVLKEVDVSKRCLEIMYTDSRFIPDYEGEFYDMDDYMKEDDMDIWRGDEPLLQAVHSANLPEFMWADIAPQFYSHSNGNKEHGIVIG